MTIHRLTPLQIKTLGPGLHNDGGGLHLAIGESSDSRSWVFRYQFRGRRRHMGLGPARDITLQKARELAAKHRQTIAIERIDPLDKRRLEDEAIAAAMRPVKRTTFKECALQYAHNKQIGTAAWVPAHAKNWEASAATYIYPKIGNVPVEDITLQHVLQVLKPIWVDKPKLAKDVRARLGAIIDFAIANQWYTKGNPAKLKAVTELLPNQPKAKNHAALHYDDLAEFMNELRADEKPVNLLLEFIVLTAVRRDEAREAEWDEINFTKKVWTIPAERMKEREEHAVPLSSAALAILEKLKALKQNKFVFPGALNPQVSRSAVGEALVALRPGITLHGFRACFRTWFASRTTWPREVGESCLAHAVGTAVERAYNREKMLERRRPVMEAWSEFCAGAAASTDNIVPIRA